VDKPLKWCKHIRAIILEAGSFPDKQLVDWVYDTKWVEFIAGKLPCRVYEPFDGPLISSLPYGTKFCPWCGKKKPEGY